MHTFHLLRTRTSTSRISKSGRSSVLAGAKKRVRLEGTIPGDKEGRKETGREGRKEEQRRKGWNGEEDRPA